MPTHWIQVVILFVIVSANFKCTKPQITETLSFSCPRRAKQGEEGDCSRIDDQETATHNHQFISSDDECTLYIAESTIPNAGLGAFTTLPRIAGERTLGPGQLCLPFLDWNLHISPDFLDPLNDYFWDGGSMGMFSEGTTVSALCMGLGSIVNSHLALINTKRSTVGYDPLWKRHEHPGAGAISPYHDATSAVVRDIPAGGEIFKFYGDEWFLGRTATLGYLPLVDNWIEAEQLLQRLDSFSSKQSHAMQLALYRLVLSIRDVYSDSRTLNAFPKTLDRAQIAARESLSSAFQPDHVRAPAWLKEHGRCADSIVPGNSTIPGAGRGAFAKRAFAKGQIVTTSPLRHFPQTQYDNMAIYQISWDEELEKYVRHLDKVISHQIAVNYCHGHVKSTLLLCPYGSGVGLINGGSAEDANIRIRWAHNFSGHKSDFLQNSTLTDLEWIDTTEFAFDFVALRSIAKGEELLMDYGRDWAQGWMNHVERWQRFQEKSNKNSSMSAREMNEQLLLHSAIRTAKEQEADPYPETVEIRCHVHVIRDNSPSNYAWEPNSHGHPCQVLHRYKSDKTETATAASSSSSSYPFYHYMVDIEVWPSPLPPFMDVTNVSLSANDPSSYYPTTATRLIRSKIPRHAMKFFDKPGTTDLNQPEAFRHWIGIPNDMFPDQWKNKR